MKHCFGVGVQYRKLLLTKHYPPSSRPKAMASTLNSWLSLNFSTCLAAGERLSLFSACEQRIYILFSLSVCLRLLCSQVCLLNSALINMLSPSILQVLLSACFYGFFCLLSSSFSSWAFCPVAAVPSSARGTEAPVHWDPSCKCSR